MQSMRFFFAQNGVFLGNWSAQNWRLRIRSLRGRGTEVFGQADSTRRARSEQHAKRGGVSPLLPMAKAWPVFDIHPQDSLGRRSAQTFEDLGATCLVAGLEKKSRPSQG